MSITHSTLIQYFVTSRWAIIIMSILILTGTEAVEQWYSEIKDYDFKSHSTGLKTGK